MITWYPERHFSEEPLYKTLVISVGLHLFILFIILIKHFVFPSEPFDYTSAIRVDMVALPDKIQNLPPAASPKETVAEKQEPTPAIVEEKVPTQKELPVAKPKNIDTSAIKLDKTKAALNKLKAMSALEKIKQQVEKEKQDEEFNKKKELALQKIKGNMVASGNSLTGIEKLEHNTYITELDHHIKQYWALPEWLNKKSLRTQILVKIDENGSLISKQVIKTSGNRAYDEEALATIEKSAPFPLPPDKFVSLLRYTGFIVGFPD